MMRSSVIASSLIFASAIGVTPLAAPTANVEHSPIYGVTIPVGYRNWQFVAPAHEGGSLNELRVIVGNDKAMKAYRTDTLPFPDGSILVKLAWRHVPLVLKSDPGPPQAFLAGHATSVQIMVKDSKKYASTGGWGFGKFIDGKATDEAQHQTCLSCHEANVKEHDIVFTHYAP